VVRTNEGSRSGSRKHRARIALPVAAALIAVAGQTEILAQEAPLRPSYEREWRGAVQRIGRLAEAIPEETYGWRPGEGVRSVSEAVMHIAHGNFLFADALGFARPEDLPENLETITKKDEVLDVLRRSVEQFDGALKSAFETGLDREAPNFGTAGAVLLRALAHANEHLGQLIAYARVNGIVPPWSR